MYLIARAFALLDGISLYATFYEDDPVTGEQRPERTLTSTVSRGRAARGQGELAEELARLLQEWAWTERGV